MHNNVLIQQADTRAYSLSSLFVCVCGMQVCMLLHACLCVCMCEVCVCVCECMCAVCECVGVCVSACVKCVCECTCVVCMCASKCVCFVCVCAVCASVCGGPRLISGIILYCFLPQALKQGLSMKPRVCQLFSFTDLLAPGIPCLCLSKLELQASHQTHPVVTWVWRI